MQYGSKMLINTDKYTPIIDSNGEKRINSKKKIDEIVLHPMHGGGGGNSTGKPFQDDKSTLGPDRSNDHDQTNPQLWMFKVWTFKV